jgi:hypothetical protein
MEEFIGSIPIRSTNYFNNLENSLPLIWQHFGSKSHMPEASSSSIAALPVGLL